LEQTIQANHLESITLNNDASVAAIGRALSAIHQFINDVAVEAIHARELPIGDQRTVMLLNSVATLGQTAQVFSGSSNLAIPQPVPQQMGPRRM
jgi:UDP-3-O-acyl-N-acetylglucosamine deacetylase